MTYPHSHPCSIPVTERVVELSPDHHPANTLVFPLDGDISARIPTQTQTSRSLYPVINGEVIASRTLAPLRPIPASEPKRNFRRRSLDDPYWILVTLVITLGVSITATAVYGIIQITLAIGRWFTTNGTTLATIAALVIILALCGGTTAAKCAGIHCRGCNR